MTPAWIRGLLSFLLPLLLCVCVGLLVPARPQGGDTLGGSYGALALNCRGSFDLALVQPFRDSVRAGQLPYYLRISQDRRQLLSTFGPAPAVWGALWGTPPERGRVVTAQLIEERARTAGVIALSLAAGLFGVALWLQQLRLRWSCLGALVVGCSFAGVGTLGQGLWQQGLGLLCLSAALWSLPRLISPDPEAKSRKEQRLGGHVARGAWLGAWCALGIWVRPPDAVLYLSLGVSALLAEKERASRLKLLLAAALAGSIVSLPFALYQHSAFDEWLPFGQVSVHGRMGTGLFVFSSEHIARALLGLLVSPGRGILWYFPLFVGVGFLWQRRTSPLIVGLLAQLLVYCCFYKWWGGLAFGPRLLALSAWLACFVVFSMYQSLRSWWRRVVVVLGLWGLAVGLLGALRYDARGWELAHHHERSSAAYFQWRDSPWAWLVLGERAVLNVKDSVPGLLIYCAPRSAEALSSLTSVSGGAQP